MPEKVVFMYLGKCAHTYTDIHTQKIKKDKSHEFIKNKEIYMEGFEKGEGVFMQLYYNIKKDNLKLNPISRNSIYYW